MGPLALRGYYAILDVKREEGDAPASEILTRATALLAGGPCCLQLRAKHASAARMLELARALLPLCRRAQVPLCVNDRVDVALVAGADAVHVGQEDLSVADVRAVLADTARRLWIGVSTHDPAQARAAAALGADYLGFGPVFPTATKDRPDPVTGLEALREVARAVSLPVVAIGGITRARAAAVAAAGASAAAVISDVEAAASLTEAARQIAAAFERGAPSLTA